jgi:acetoin utilization deacetylase AcuC-like enzyme
MIRQVERSPYWETALYSAGGTVQAAEKICKGEIDNAFVFTGVGDHHAGRNFFGGGCYLNGIVLSVTNLRQKYGKTKFAVIDTDAHHGNGMWDLFRNNKNVLYVCFCTAKYPEENNNINVTIPYHSSDRDYLEKVEDEFVSRCKNFKPEIIFWNWGYDGTQGEYGDLGLSLDFHANLANMLKSNADEVCNGKLVVVLCGGSSRRVATYAIPQIISCLAEVGEEDEHYFF